MEFTPKRVVRLQLHGHAPAMRGWYLLSHSLVKARSGRVLEGYSRVTEASRAARFREKDLLRCLPVASTLCEIQMVWQPKLHGGLPGGGVVLMLFISC